MKKVLIILTLILIFPMMVNAKEYCKVVSGDGKSIGSEIACGSEHFYILSSEQNEVRMLAKYNLYTGVSIYKEKIEKEAGDTRTDAEYCADLANEKGGTIKADGFYYSEGYCFYAVDNIKDATQKILQKEVAKSAHWDADLNYLYPQVGDVYMPAGTYPFTYEENQPSIYQNTRFYDIDIFPEIVIEDEDNYQTISSSTIKNMLFYKKELIEMGYEIENISLLPVSELSSITQKISNKSLPLVEWSQDFGINYSESIGTYVYGDLKPYIPKEYSWLYSTTYWNSTKFYIDGRHPSPNTYDYYVFTAEQGKLCGAGFQACAPETTLGCGIRPVITVTKNNLMYIIKTKTDGNGTIEVVDSAAGGDQITFKATPKNGYKLKSIVVKTDSGETVEFTKGEMITNSDGTISIDKNKFTMPFENVTIEGNWKLDIINPKTGRNILVIIGIVGLVGISLKLKNKKISS